jgi:hypothetical protein
MNGWAVHESGITKVCVYVDRRRVSCTENVNGARPDVRAAWPAFAGSDKSGWQIQLDSAGLAPGEHVLVVQAVSKGGSVQDIGTLNVTVAK